MLAAFRAAELTTVHDLLDSDDTPSDVNRTGSTWVPHVRRQQ
ncbi:MAG: hypothetical protein IPH40_04915 [Polaromonas sp.]|nr:hypothetical protein [Polaromonas sp.]